MRELAVILLLVGTVPVAQGKSPVLDDIVDSLLHLISCNLPTTTGGVTFELATVYRKCKDLVDMKDERCMFPCIANELGLIVRSKLMDDAVSEYISNQFKNLDPGQRKNWTEGIKTCFNQYESLGGKFQTVYKHCNQQTDDFRNLSTCVLLARDCATSFPNPDNFRNAMMPGYKRNKRQAEFAYNAIPLGTPILRRIFIIGLAFGIVGSLGLSSQAIINSQKCGSSGCYNGYCYSYCGLSNDSNDWCYTTKTFSQSFEYVKCNSAEECDGCWKCAGSCALG